MNQGIYGFPSTLSTSSIISITEFDASGTYSIPTEATELEILLVGGGGGGGGGARAAGAPGTFNRGGGAGGAGGGFVHTVIQTKDLQGRNTLIITIGQGGAGGAGRAAALGLNASEVGTVATAGGSSTITMQNFSGFVIYAVGGGGGGAGTVPSNPGAAAAGANRNSLATGSVFAMDVAAVGSSSTEPPSLTYTSFRSNGGAGGGSATSTTTGFPGGSIRIDRNGVLNPLVLNLQFGGPTFDGLTAAYGGIVSGGTLGAGKGTDGIQLYKTSAGTYLFGGVGGAGGGAANTDGAGNGGNGYRGGGGGGGGGVHAATALSANQVPSGSGGNGGNGYCRIIARR